MDGFEIGVLLEGTSDSHIHNMETKNNDSATPTHRDGVALWDSHNNQITNVYSHDNGHNGISLRNASTGNLLRGNINNDNGNNVNVFPNGGCGIQLIGGGNNGNIIAGNETLRQGWGIQIGSGSDDNRVVHNRAGRRADRAAA